MRIEIVRDKSEVPDAVWLVFRTEDGALDGVAKDFLSEVRRLEQFSGKAGRIRLHSGDQTHVLSVGLGRAEDVDLDGFRSAVGTAVRAAASQDIFMLAVDTEHLQALNLAEDLVLEFVLAARLAAYRFVEFKSDPGEADGPHRVIICGGKPDLAEHVGVALAISQGIELARDLVNTPANVATADFLAQTAQGLAQTHHFGLQIFGPEEITALGMGAFAAVFRGSSVPARFIILDSAPGSTEKPLVFVGKGITFDTGGLSLKPAAKMHEMKSDMAGAAAILGLFKALGLAQVPRRVVGLMPCCDNMPDSRATRPGDVVTALNGKTIEILNTDAEGRLLLADALAYSVRFEPKIVVDLATLTGACVVALGSKVAAIFATTADLDQQIRECGSRVGERFWPLPLWKEFAAPLKSQVADLKNIATREGGAIYAALFLKNFVPAGVDWAHLDIAGPAWTDENSSIFRPGGTGFGLRTLWELVAFYTDEDGF